MNRTSMPFLTAPIAALVERGDTVGLRDALAEVLERPDGGACLRALDRAGLLTQILPELEPARAVDQPIVHFLPVLAHSLETVVVIDWLMAQLAVVARANTRVQHDLPAAVQAHPQLRYVSVYSQELREHFATPPAAGHSRPALLRLAALLHDVAKPQTKQRKPGGGVSFHEHQTIGGLVAGDAARRLGFGDDVATYLGAVVRAHMRPGQLAAQGDVTWRALRRFFESTGGAGPDILLHALADHMATRGPDLNVAAWYAQMAWTDALLDTIWGEQVAPERPLVNGVELMRALDIAPGPLVGRLLAAIGEAQAGGDIATPAEAIALARRRLRAD
jgi:poly(A) polymerase/tRNA nucleotidyltransferase (CCA-adding enzyme)